MKTEPMTQQVDALVAMENREFYALGAEQGTGKTWVALADAERLWRNGRINGMLVVTLNGVHDNWVRREIPAHLECEHHAVAWNSKAGKREMAKIERVLHADESELAILTMNIDAINTKKGSAFVDRFMDRYTVYMVMDESQIIKNPQSKANKRAKVLGERAAYRRILSGTLVADKPLDLFGQYHFLADGLLGTTSYRAFVSRYAVILPQHHPLVQHAKAASRGRGEPQIIAKDKDGHPQYRNLEKLKERLRPHTFRVLKKDCMDLPEKIYQSHYFDLTPAQRRTYNHLKENLRVEWGDREPTIVDRLSAQTKLQQITSGYILEDGEPTILIEDNPRTAAFVSLLGNIDGSILVWARYRAEVDQIARACSLKRIPHAVYYGDTKKVDREKAVDDLQSGEVKVFIATEAAARGLTLTKAETSIYYSNSFKREVRVQSEDRNHRKGTVNPVVYIDLVAKDTVDEDIVKALQIKTAVADFVMDF